MENQKHIDFGNSYVLAAHDPLQDEIRLLIQKVGRKAAQAGFAAGYIEGVKEGKVKDSAEETKDSLFSVGDRVEAINDCGTHFKVGDKGVVTKICPHTNAKRFQCHVRFDNGHETWCFADEAVWWKNIPEKPTLNGLKAGDRIVAIKDTYLINFGDKGVVTRIGPSGSGEGKYVHVKFDNGHETYDSSEKFWKKDEDPQPKVGDRYVATQNRAYHFSQGDKVTITKTDQGVVGFKIDGIYAHDHIYANSFAQYFAPLTESTKNKKLHVADRVKVLVYPF